MTQKVPVILTSAKAETPVQKQASRGQRKVAYTRLPVVGLRIPYDATFTFKEGRSLATRIDYNESQDQWCMCDPQGRHGLMAFFTVEPTEETIALRVSSLAKTGTAVYVEPVK